MKLNVNYSIFIGVSVDGHQAVNLWFYEDKHKIIGCLTSEGYNTSASIIELIEIINNIFFNKIFKSEITGKIDQPPAFTLNITYDYAEFINEFSAWGSVKISTFQL